MAYTRPASTAVPPKKARKRVTPTLVSSLTQIGNIDHDKNKRVKTSKREAVDEVVLTLADNDDYKDENDPGTDPTSTSVTLSMSRTKPTKTIQLESHADLQALFARSAKTAYETRQQWVRDPDMEWIQNLKDEIITNHDKLQQLEQLSKQVEVDGGSLHDDDVFGKWELRADFATKIIHLWLEDKSLDQVLQKADELGQLRDDLKDGGLVLDGSLVRDRIAATTQKNNNNNNNNNDCSSPSSLADWKNLSPLVQKLCCQNKDTNEQSLVSLYRVQRHNHFILQKRQTIEFSELEREIQNDPVHALKGCGSLNTIYDYGTAPATTNHNEQNDNDTEKSSLSGMPLLDTFYEEMEELTNGIDPTTTVELNRRLYLIWKGCGYMTPHHQDSHVPPQITIYHQLSGTSVFHFLPVLVGMYVTHLGRRTHRNSVAEAQRVLYQLDQRGIGTVTTLTTGSVAMIFPFGSHGVFVPPMSKSSVSTKSTTSLSTIRAAEFFVQPLLSEIQQRFLNNNSNKKNHWCKNLMPLSQHDRECSKAFETAQNALLDTLNLSKQEWLFYARRMVEGWEQESQDETINDDGD